MVENVSAVAGSTIDLQDYAIPAEEPPSGELGKDAFLKLLVAQLKYQDPLEPSTSEEFIATTAQFTVVEKLDELTKQGANTALVNSLTTASALVGREVTANRNGVPVTAVVQQSMLESGAVVLETDKGSIELNEIVSVGPAPVVAVKPAVQAEQIPAPEAPATTVSPTVQAEQISAPDVDSDDGAAAPVATDQGPAATGPVDAEPTEATVEPIDVAVAVSDGADDQEPAAAVAAPTSTVEQIAGPSTSPGPVDGRPTASVSSATSPAFEDADHAEWAVFDPFDAA